MVTQKRSNTIGHDAGLLHTPIECEFSAPSWVERLDQYNYNSIRRMGTTVTHTSFHELTHPDQCKSSASSTMLGMILRSYK